MPGVRLLMDGRPTGFSVTLKLVPVRRNIPMRLTQPGPFRLISCWKRIAASGSSCNGQDYPFASRAGLCILETEVGTPLRRTIQVRISRGDRQFVAECLDLPV